MWQYDQLQFTLQPCGTIKTPMRRQWLTAFGPTVTHSPWVFRTTTIIRSCCSFIRSSMSATTTETAVQPMTLSSTQPPSSDLRHMASQPGLLPPSPPRPTQVMNSLSPNRQGSRSPTSIPSSPTSMYVIFSLISYHAKHSPNCSLQSLLIICYL